MKEKLFFIDLETTGLSAWKNGLTQFGGIIDIGDKTEEIEAEMSIFPNDEIDDEALNVTGMTREEILSKQSPLTFYASLKSTLLSHVNKFDKTDKFHFIGYNAKFDEGFLRSWFKKCGDRFFGSYFHFPIIDVAQIASMKILTNSLERPKENFRLGTVCRHFGIDFDEDEAHDAMFDIRKTRELFYKLTEIKHGKLFGSS